MSPVSRASRKRLTHSSCPVHTCGMNTAERMPVSRQPWVGLSRPGFSSRLPTDSHHDLEPSLHFLGLPSPYRAEAAPASFSQSRRKLRLARGHKSTLRNILSCFLCFLFSSFHPIYVHIHFSYLSSLSFSYTPQKLCITNLAFLPAPTHWLTKKINFKPNPVKSLI